MRNDAIARRDFLKKCFGATAALGSLPFQKLYPAGKGSPYDSKGLPTRILGKTSVPVPLIAFGGGSRFCRVKAPEESVEILNYALDHGFYYWDTAHDYVYDGVVSEERFGLVLKERRKEVFLATKVGERSFDGVLRHLEESLKRLQTGRLDLYQVHLVRSLEDVERIFARDGVFRALQRLKDEKVTRFIGFTGHLSAEAMMEMVRRGGFDTMLIALNHYEERQGDFEGGAIPAAAGQKMGVLVMKVVRPRETVETVNPEELIRYALSLDDVHAAVIGTDSLDVLKKNIELVKNFNKMSPAGMERIKAELAPFFASQNVAWMRPGYTDGTPV